MTAVIFGALSGLVPPWLDALLMRVTELILSIPSLLIILLLQATLGEATILSLSLVIGLTGWPGIAKVVRTEVRQIRSSGYVAAARTMGAGFFHILRKHLTPNFLPSILFMIVMNIRNAITARIHPQLYRRGTSAENDLLGQYALPFRTGRDDRVLVDYPDSRFFPGDRAPVRHKYRKLSAEKYG